MLIRVLRGIDVCKECLWILCCASVTILCISAKLWPFKRQVVNDMKVTFKSVCYLNVFVSCFIELRVLAARSEIILAAFSQAPFTSWSAIYLYCSCIYSLDFDIDSYFRCFTFSCILAVFLLVHVVSSCYISYVFSLCLFKKLH